VQGFTELLLLQPGTLDDRQRVRQYLELIQTASSDAASVVKRLRSFYRPQTAEETLCPVDMSQIIAEVLSLTQFRWKDQALAEGIRIDTVTDVPDLPPVMGDASELREALTNLIFNAVDAMPQGGSLTIRARVEGDRLVTTVTDTGVGMTEEARERCLEPFFTTKGDDGSGLGLAMVYGIVQRHGGSIDFESEPGKGTTTLLRLPLASTETTTEAHQPTIERYGPPLRVLVAEDEPSLRRLIEDYLRLDGHMPDAAADGLAAATKFQSGNYDVVMTDRAMPLMSGDELAMTVKQHAPGTPVIMLTGFGELMLSANELPKGLDLVLGKPVSLADLRQAFKKVATAA
jgi:CheY-like chemotaxis protein/anti-sigma regulatory factor (Ser/Thr protein kinase)